MNKSIHHLLFIIISTIGVLLPLAGMQPNNVNKLIKQWETKIQNQKPHVLSIEEIAIFLEQRQKKLDQKLLRYIDNAKEVEQLLSKRANPNIYGEDNMQLLHYAAVAGKITLARTLLNHGANVNGCTTKQSTALHYAAWNNQEKTVFLLLKKKANVLALDENGHTAQKCAALWGHTDIANLLDLYLLKSNLDLFGVQE